MAVHDLMLDGVGLTTPCCVIQQLASAETVDRLNNLVAIACSYVLIYRWSSATTDDCSLFITELALISKNTNYVLKGKCRETLWRTWHNRQRYDVYRSLLGQICRNTLQYIDSHTENNSLTISFRAFYPHSTVNLLIYLTYIIVYSVYIPESTHVCFMLHW